MDGSYEEEREVEVRSQKSVVRAQMRKVRREISLKNYLTNVIEWNQFRYIFNRAKTPGLDAVKKEFQKVFLNNAEQIWNANSTQMENWLKISTILFY